MGWGDKMDHCGSTHKGEIPLRRHGDEKRQLFVMLSSTEVAEKQLGSSSAPKWVGFKTLHPVRAIPQLLCADRGRG